MKNWSGFVLLRKIFPCVLEIQIYSNLFFLHPMNCIPHFACLIVRFIMRFSLCVSHCACFIVRFIMRFSLCVPRYACLVVRASLCVSLCMPQCAWFELSEVVLHLLLSISKSSFQQAEGKQFRHNCHGRQFVAWLQTLLWWFVW